MLLLGPDSIQSILPSTLISQVESLLESHRIQDAINLVEEHRKKQEGLFTVDVEELEELRYVYQCIGFQCLSETLFEDAGALLFAGELDPRVLVSYFPDLYGSLLGESDAVDVFAGVTERMPPEASVDEIIVANLVRNYSPHLPPNTRSAPSTVELRTILNGHARDMLEIFLRKWRGKRKIRDAKAKARNEGSDIDRVIDTVLAVLFTLGEKTTDLYALLQEPNDVVLAEIEPVLIKMSQFNVLCGLYIQRGEDTKLLEAWSRLVEGEWTDEDVSDPLSNMLALLNDKRDRTLIQRWGIWLTKKDPERGFKLLTTRDLSKKPTKLEDDLALLAQLQETNPAVGVRYLEFLVLQKRGTDKNLHTQLATACIDQLFECLSDDSTSKLWRAKASSYASSRSDTPFLSYFASTTPESASKRVRLKTALLLQGSSAYDTHVVRARLQGKEKMLSLEVAILEGKLGNHRAAISTLVHDLRDAVSAEAYCTLGGIVVSAKVAATLGAQYDLAAWAALCGGDMTTSAPGASNGALQGETGKIKLRAGANGGGPSGTEEGLKKQLLRYLLEVYMEDGESYRTARLLSSQAVNLDVVDVIPLVPSDWSLSVLSSFLSRSFRRTLHARHEGQIVKAISSGQNLEALEQSWLIIREQGAIIEEAVEGDGDDGYELDANDEKAALAEKVALHVHLTNQMQDRFPAEDVARGLAEDDGDADRNRDENGGELFAGNVNEAIARGDGGKNDLT